MCTPILYMPKGTITVGLHLLGLHRMFLCTSQHPVRKLLLISVVSQ